ncbi:hypothetical protein NLX71_11970 [Paenibacillus sp. MZ04-78.2]|uniref:hypothetical protein n=1 Tax=Paenibacillus sp. MZ04-78.2 TaxID=2962034 RepID=UPI0020B6C553|nr:hypothetical protein [Paenibacillus sp. MZ04-78.2]MCP3774019.1 hypothetical protein [Paenibacillus sp. MZ04-78.2]
MDTIWPYSIRTLIGFFVLLLFFTYITGIVLGNIAGEMVVHKEVKVIAGITAMTIWALLTIMIEQFPVQERLYLPTELIFLDKKLNRPHRFY